MKVHFTSIGGSVMHQLAIALKKKGYDISGTDDEIFEPAKSNLQAEGLLPQKIGWQPELLTKNIDAVILGMHAKADNPEIAKAKELGLKIYSFPEYIYQESVHKKRVVIGGSHGKTTTTSMIMHVLQTLQKDVDYLAGAKLQGFNQSVNITNAPLIICEGDEYPASTLEKRPKFHFLFPHIAVLTGIAWDHINVFPTFDIYKEQFVIFIQKIEKGGLLIYNENDAVLKELIETNKRNDIQYQPYAIPKHTIENGNTIITIDDETVALKIFGNHNLQNLYAAYFVCKELGINTHDFLHAIKNFTGASKRLELIANNNTTNIYRDFAHAPSKVIATIEAVKQQYPNRTLIAVLELHTYSSLNKNFLDEYKDAMAKADIAVVFYAKHALELKQMPPLPKEIVYNSFNKENLIVINTKEELNNWLHQQNYANSNLLLMSSGDYDGVDITTLSKSITA
ncbi:MAG: peptidoglycan synthetase [Chitinophagaceae bacterium]|nr:peptidoglycan synthetase [Chitinophagaceae bacterium]MCW5905841.1 peptidoglycan synthetase [Chitinophagaceae bacterium]